MSDLAWLTSPAARRRTLILLKYEGPFERLMNWLWCLDPVTSEITKVVPEGTLRNWLACRAETMDRAWREHYARCGRDPAGRWRRMP